MGNCPNCGTPARPQARFCSKCGSPLVTGAGITPPPPPQPSPEKQSMRQTAAPVQSGPLILPSAAQEEFQVTAGTQLHAEVTLPEVEGEEAVAVADSMPVTRSLQEETAPSDADTDTTVAEAVAPAAEIAAQQPVPAVDVASAVALAEVLAQSEPPIVVAAASDEHAVEYLPLVMGKAGVAEQRFVIVEKLLSCVSFAQPDHRERNRSVLERLIRQSLPISETAWGQMAYIAGIYGSLMGGNLLTTQQKLELWQSLLWAIQYEYYFRSSQFVERFGRLAGFLHTCNADKAFQAAALSSLETVLLQFDKQPLRNVREAMERMPASHAITSLKQLLDRCIERDDSHEILAALERLWNRLDRNREEQNRATMEEARQSGLTPQVTARLVVMSVFVCKHFLEHVPPVSANGISDEELRAALTLSAFASNFATGSYIAEAQKCDAALKAVQERHAGWHQEAQQAPMKALPVKVQPAKAPIERVQPAPVSPLDRGQQNGNMVEAVDGEKQNGKNGVNRATPETNSIPETKVSPGWQEDPRRRLEAIFGAEALTSLLQSMRDYRFDLMRTTLRRGRLHLLSTLSDMLAALPFCDELLSPRSAFSLRGNVQGESFPELKKFLLGPGEEDRRRALAQLEAMERDALERDAALAHEWVLFGRAVVLGLNKALPEWREYYYAKTASSEEIWNLAVVALRSGDKVQALEMLRPLVKEQRASVAHLCLALKCGLDILLQAEHYARPVTGMAMAFLLDALPLLPLPESYLVWLSLASEVQEAPDYNRQSDAIGLCLGLLERPLQLLLTDRRATEISIDTFGEECRELLATIKQLEHRYSLELHDGKITIQSKMVRSFLHTVEAKRSRVGLFVDYENLRPWLPMELQERPEEVGMILTQHAAQYGDVVCRWFCAAPHNLPDSAAVAREFQDIGFKVQFPRGRTGQLSPKENVTDFVVVECIVFEQAHSQPDVYIIVSGDADYFERVSRLIEEGNSVHIVACRNNVSNRYVRLAGRYAQGQFPEEHGGIFIDYLENILASRGNVR